MNIDIGHVLLHSLEDTARMLPFLFAAYLVIEWLERKKSESIEHALAKGGRFGFVPGAALGLIPQCGFSAAAANLFASRIISLGTLIAVFLSTSDEAIPVMLSQPDSYGRMMKLLAFKLGYALLVGFLLDFVLLPLLPKKLTGRGGGQAPVGGAHSHEDEGGIFLAAAKHTAVVIGTVFVFTLVFGFVVEALGHEFISQSLSQLGFFQPLVAALFGLIPSCASSVLLTQLYLTGDITFGSVLAGLSANAGVGLTVLFRTNKDTRQNIFITVLLLVLGSVFGLVVQLLGIV